MMAWKGIIMADVRALIVALASGNSVRKASELAGISERSVWRKLQDPNFRARISQLRGESVAQAVGILTESMTEAATTLRSLLSASSEVVRLGASRALLELGTKLRDVTEFESRLQALERNGTQPCLTLNKANGSTHLKNPPVIPEKNEPS
jgi:hypothetical protein